MARSSKLKNETATPDTETSDMVTPKNDNVTQETEAGGAVDALADTAIEEDSEAVVTAITPQLAYEVMTERIDGNFTPWDDLPEELRDQYVTLFEETKDKENVVNPYQLIVKELTNAGSSNRESGAGNAE